jgi:YidC/Oxa1 family membrane protein insertase
MDNNRNLILAIALSLAVLFGWQLFFAGPEIERARQEQAVQQAQVPAPPAVPGVAGTPPVPGAAGAPGAARGESTSLSRDAALASAPRVRIASDRLNGSINLRGGRIDDLRLHDYRQTVEPNSPTVVLLSPSGAPDAQFVEFAWMGGAEAGLLPGRDTLWTAPPGVALTPATPVTLTYDNGAGLQFARTIALDDKYMFTVTDTVKNGGNVPVTLQPGGRVTRVGEVFGGSWIQHVGLIGVMTGKLELVGYGDLRSNKEKIWSGVSNGWVGITDKYWAAVLIPDKAKPFTGRFAYAANGAEVFEANFAEPAASVAPGAAATATTHLFAGAKQVSVLDQYTEQYGITLFDRLIDWGWFWFFTKPLFYLIDWFYRLLGNFGLAILAVTVVVKLAFFPLANRSYRSMSAMRKVQPQLLEIRDRYKDDKAKQQQAMMELYKKEKINPLAGCWPVAVQIPVFFALYSVLFVSLEMRHAPFFGWIRDLAAPDPTSIFNLFGLLPFNPGAIPIIGAFLVLGVWPILMGITMFVQMKLNPAPTDPTQQMLFTWMPVLFTFMLAGFPAGLVIYWAWNNFLSILQQYVIMRRSGTKVELWANIRDTFRRRPKPSTVAQPAGASAAAAVTMTKPANDPGVPPVAKHVKAKQKKPRPAGAKG